MYQVRYEVVSKIFSIWLREEIAVDHQYLLLLPISCQLSGFMMTWAREISWTIPFLGYLNIVILKMHLLEIPTPLRPPETAATAKFYSWQFYCVILTLPQTLQFMHPVRIRPSGNSNAVIFINGCADMWQHNLQALSTELSTTSPQTRLM